MKNDSALVSAIVGMMRECWGELPETKIGELEDYAYRLLRMVRHDESKIAIEQYVAARQHEFGITSPIVTKEIAERVTALVKNSNRGATNQE